jgi:hypothetical protein
MTISFPSISTDFIPPGAISSALIARTNFSLKARLLWRQLRKCVGIEHVRMHEKSAPAAFDGVEMLPVERDARANDPHVARSIVTQRLARTKGDPVLVFQGHFLFEQKIHELRVGRKLES